MSNATDSIYSKYLSELNEFEKNLSESNIEDFERWKQNVIDNLSVSQKIRFSNLKFYEMREIDTTDLPF